jgi:hypothetical protein
MTNTKILLILAQDALDRARVLAGRATAALKLPVIRPRRFASSGAPRVSGLDLRLSGRGPQRRRT